MTFTIRYNRNTDHIEGISERTPVSADGMNYAVSACPALSRSGVRLAVGFASDDLREVLENFGKLQKACKKCEKAANLVLAEIEAAESEAAKAQEQAPVELHYQRCRPDVSCSVCR